MLARGAKDQIEKKRTVVRAGGTRSRICKCACCCCRCVTPRGYIEIVQAGTARDGLPFFFFLPLSNGILFRVYEKSVGSNGPLMTMLDFGSLVSFEVLCLFKWLA